EGRCQAIEAAIRRDQESFSRAKTRFDRQQAELERNQRDAVDAVAALPALDAEAGSIATQLVTGQFALAPRRRLTEIGDELRAIGYDEAAHHRARTEVAELVGADAEHTELQLAE